MIVVRNIIRNDVRSDDGWINTHFRSFNQPVRIAGMNAAVLPIEEGVAQAWTALRNPLRRYLQKPYRKSGSPAGLLARIASMRSTTSGVNCGATSSAAMFSTTCSGRDAPVMTVLTFGLRRHQAKATAPGCSPVRRRSA